ncbi:MAG: hypothetical protein GY754_24990 [bacterium]|nr:hypothetical protein [bacterium]
MNNLASHKLSWIFLGLQLLVAMICITVGSNSAENDSVGIYFMCAVIFLICVPGFALGGIISGITAIVNSSKNNYSRSGPIASLVANSVSLVLLLVLLFGVLFWVLESLNF